jgi:hypothetical protein
MPHMLPVLVEEQDRAQQAGKLGFDNPYQMIEYFFKRSIASDLLQNTTLSITQRLCSFAFRDVYHGTDELNKIAGWSEDGMAYCVDVTDFAAGMKDSVIELELGLFTACSFEVFQGTGSIIRMNALKESLDTREATVRVKTQHAVALFGPVRDVARLWLPGPTSGATKPLGLRQVCLAPPQSFFRLLGCGDVHHGSNKLDHAG